MVLKEHDVSFSKKADSCVNTDENGLKDFSQMSNTKKKHNLAEKLQPKTDFTLAEKVMIVIGSLGISINVVYSNTICSSISIEFEKWYQTNASSYFWFTQVGIIVQVLTYIPAAYLFSKYLRFCVQFSVLTIMLGTTLKLVAPKSNVMLYIGHIFVQLAAPYAYIATAQIGNMIFDKRGVQTFVAAVNITPFFLQIGFVLYPPFAAQIGGDASSIVVTTHRIGQILAFMALPLQLVKDKWDIKSKEEVENIDKVEECESLIERSIDNLKNTQNTNQSQAEQNLDNEVVENLQQNEINQVQIVRANSATNTKPAEPICSIDETSIFQIIKTRRFWSGAQAFGLIQPPFVFLSCDYAYYLKLQQLTEQTSSINTSFVLGIGIVGGILVNLSHKYNFMTCLLYIIMAFGMILIAQSTILVRQRYLIDETSNNALESLMLFMGEVFFGVGIIGNLSFVTMALCSLYPKVDYCILLALPQTIGTLTAVVFCTMIMKLGDWAMLGFAIFYYCLTVFQMCTLPKDSKKSEKESLEL